MTAVGRKIDSESGHTSSLGGNAGPHMRIFGVRRFDR
jgi:hypothetical protein